MATKRRSKKRKRRRKHPSPADPKNRLKPISLHGIEFDEVMRRLVQRSPQPPGGADKE